MLTITQEGGRSASEEGRSRSQASTYQSGYRIPNPTPQFLHLFPLASPSMHQPKWNSKQHIQYLHAASAYFTSSSRQMFSRSIPQYQTAKEAAAFFQGLDFHNLQSHRETSTWENPELEYVGQAAFFELTHPAGTSCQKEEIWEAEYGLQNHVNVEKKLTKKKHVQICLKTSLYKCLYIHTVICSTGSLSDYGGK